METVLEGQPGGPCSDDGIGTAAMQALAEVLAAPDLLTSAQCQGAADTYRRHLLYADPQGRFTALCLVWRPGQASAVHGHTAWCTVGVVSGVAHEERFDLVEDEDEGGLRAVHLVGRDADHRAGAVLMTRPGPDGVHRISNAGPDDLVSIHVYGRDLTVDPTLINVVYDE
ncbi:MAG: cysteine dioxygenase [Planctomycetota bacterium]